MSADIQAAAGPPPTSAEPPFGEDLPQRLGEYAVVRLLGEGGMGRVYEAEERLSRRRVALKVLRDELCGSEQARALFVSEMQILAHLEHDNIVRSLASMEVDGKLCIALELLAGRTLRQALGHGDRLPWQRAARIALAVGRGLSAAHGQAPPVIHRDLKPENIMLTDAGAIKVMDFGIAKLAVARGGHSTQSAGTLQYMSPEQIDARPCDARSDLYCLGLVLYEMLAGDVPFRSASPRALLNMQCNDPPPPLPPDARAGLPKGIEQLLFQLLDKDPDRRPASAALVAARIESFLPDDSGCAADPPQAGAAAQARAPEAPGARTTSGGKDTLALFDRAATPRELPLRASLAIIASLAIAAAAATYLWRSAIAGERPPATAASARP